MTIAAPSTSRRLARSYGSSKTHAPATSCSRSSTTSPALVYEDLVEVEALAVTADEAVSNLPPKPRGKYGRTLARLYTLVSKTSGRAQGALERVEELVAARAAQLAKRQPARRAR